MDTLNKGTFVMVEDVCRVINEYIGTEEFDKATDGMSGNERSAFMGGLAMAGCLAVAKCQKYVAATIQLAPNEPMHGEGQKSE